MTGGEPLLARSREFLEHRVGDEQPIDMYKEFGIGRPGEMGRADRFDEVFDIDDAYYVGRVYDSGATESRRWDCSSCTETRPISRGMTQNTSNSYWESWTEA
jgi:hypothetical protein